ncbi:MAG: hypothetical protein ABIK77_05515 [candidate division WOR-3 bacterium]|uniref:Uncharacterized protein n=1 Tax=candidate division WOR-3 bacterium TaxID=2052148 RepID=A0A7V4FE41_UNCW3
MNKGVRILGYISLVIGFIFLAPIRFSLTFNLFLIIGLVGSGIVYIILVETFEDLKKIKENLQSIRIFGKLKIN